MRRFSAAGMLPAGLLLATLVCAPFAGTRTAPLTAQERPRHAGAVTSSIITAGGSVRTLVMSYLLLAAVGAVVLYVVARRARFGRDGEPVTRSPRVPAEMLGLVRPAAAARADTPATARRGHRYAEPQRPGRYGATRAERAERA